MTGSQSKGGRGSMKVTPPAVDSVAIARKIASYSKTDPEGSKFLKYMQYVSVLKKSASSTSRSRSPWMELRKYGALEAMMEALKKIFVCEDMQNLMTGVVQNPAKTSTGSPSGAGGKRNGEVRVTKPKVSEICNVALSILSNAFALDYSIRSEAMKKGFISALQQFISNFTQNGAKMIFKNAEIISRAVKCTANLSNDSHCRESVLKSGVAISILRILELANEEMENSCSSYGDGGSWNTSSNNVTSSAASSSLCIVDRSEIRQMICSCVRAIRILTSDTTATNCAKDHLLKFGSLVTVINVLTWDAKLSSDEDVVLDVIKALTSLSFRIKSAPIDVIDKLVYNAESCKLRSIVRIFENSEPESKLYCPVINCLIKFTANKDLSDCLGGLRIFSILLEKLDTTTENHYQDLIKLLMSLTKCSSFNQSHLTTSPLIGSTLKILKSSNFKEYHSWLLHVYEKLYEVSLSKLVKCDLVSYLCEILREELEDCDYACLRKKISSLDDGACSVHVDYGVCPFAPVYRCSSPSYQKIQEEMKSKMSIVEDTVDLPKIKSGEDSLSPLSSPAHSWSSGRSSPVYSDTSYASYSSLSEDEGCCSPISLNLANVKSESPQVTLASLSEDDEQVDSSGSEFSGPARKRLKLEVDAKTSCTEETSLESLKCSAKKIAVVLNILYKCTYITPFPGTMLQIVPILLGILLRGKVSMMPQRFENKSNKSDAELLDFSRRAFEVSYKIILKMCSSIQIFPEMIVSGMIPVLYRLQEPMLDCVETIEQIAVVQQYCANVIKRMVGIENSTEGYREGFIMRAILVNETCMSEDKINQMIVNIPLLYQKHPTLLRKFEMKAKSWTKILDMLKNSDDTSFYHFEDCTLALCSICNMLGVKWKALDATEKIPLLLALPSRDCLQGIVDIKDDVDVDTDTPIDNENNGKVDIPTSDSELSSTEKVKLVLDDGTIFCVKKDLLVQASPVFSAMFNGHFIETGQQRVTLPNVSKKAVTLLIDQIFMLAENDMHSNPTTTTLCDYELSTIFELFSLADRFLLEEIYQRALNTLITKYICPFSAPLIYAESVKLTSLQKSGKSGNMLGDVNLNLCILKYILTAENVRMSERCNAVRKIFDSVMPEHVVQDLKTLIEQHMFKL